MLRKKENGIEWLEFEVLADCRRLTHRVFLRHGGCSQGPYASLNLGASKGDTPRHLTENFNKIRQLLGSNCIVTADQVHGSELRFITIRNKSEHHTCDALATNTQDVPLMIRHADCQAACFYDPVNHATAMVHCGWRGNVRNIYAETIAGMRSYYGSKPDNLLVCISPSLGPERSEFIHYKTELPESFWQFQFKPNYFDLWAISEWQLIHAGILPHHLQIAKISTWANENDYFSYRRSKVTGCHGSIALLH